MPVRKKNDNILNYLIPTTEQQIQQFKLHQQIRNRTSRILILAAIQIYFNLARLRAGVIKREVRSINLANRVWGPHRTQTLTI